MPVKTRQQLQDLAENVNIIDNNTQEIEPIEVRNQYQEERDSTINILDDEVSPKEVGGKKMLSYAGGNAPTLAELTQNDLPSRQNVEDLITQSGGESNFKNVTLGTYILEESDNGKALYHELTASTFTIPFNSNIEIFRVNCKDANQTAVNGIGVTLLDYDGNSIGTWSAILENVTAIFSKVSTNTYKVIEIKEPSEVYIDLSFDVSSDAPVSEDLTFDDIITIDTTSEVLHPKLSGASYESSLDGVTYVPHTNLSNLQTWINANGSSTTYVIRAISVFGVGEFGDATVGFSYKK